MRFFRGAGTVAVRRKQVREGDQYGAIEMARYLGDSRWDYVRFRQYGNGDFRTTILDKRAIVAPYSSVAFDNVSVTHPSGASPSTTAADYAYNAAYGLTTVTGRNLQYVLPIGSTYAGLRVAVTGNSALLLVSVDGDYEAANQLPTFGELVTQGVADSASLGTVVDGHTINDDTRILDTYHGANVNSTVGGTNSYFDVHRAVTKDLTSYASHTIRVTHSGLKNLAASGTATLAVSAFTYGDGQAIQFGEAGVELLDFERALYNIIPDSQHAIPAQPTGAASSVFVGGQAHGYETTIYDRVSVFMDGTQQLLTINPPATKASAWSTGTEAVLTVPSMLHHPTLPDNVTDAFATDTTGNYTWSSLSNVTVSGGTLNVATTANRTAITGTAFSDGIVTMKFTTGASVASWSHRILGRASAIDTYLYGQCANGTLTIGKVVAGVATTLATGSLSSVVTGTPYWMRLSMHSTRLAVSIWDTDPGTASPVPNPLQVLVHTLSSANNTAFPAGKPGFRTGAGGTDWTYDDFEARPSWADITSRFELDADGLDHIPSLTPNRTAVLDDFFLTMSSYDGFTLNEAWPYGGSVMSLTEDDDSIVYSTTRGAVIRDPDGDLASNWEIESGQLGILDADPSISTGAPNSKITKFYKKEAGRTVTSSETLTTTSTHRLGLVSSEVTNPNAGPDVELLRLDGLDLNDEVFGLAEVDFTPPKERQEWIGAADSEHSVLVRTPLHENRTITATIDLAAQATKDQALEYVAQIRDRLKAASEDPDGVELLWSPGGSNLSVIFDVLTGEVTGFPIDDKYELANSPTVTITLTAKPYWKATVETTVGWEVASTPTTTEEIVNSVGDIPALGTLIIHDSAGQARRHVEWGLEGPLTYNSATSLLVDSDDMTVGTGYIGSQETGTGYDPNSSGSTNILSANATPIPAALCGIGNLSHVGVFRVKARIQSATGYSASVRLSWRVGDGTFVSNAWVTPRSAATWEEHDLGTVTIPASTAGAQRWTGQIEVQQVFTDDLALAASVNVRLDYLILIPAGDGYGKSRADYTYRVGATSIYDDFIGVGNLNGSGATIGGAWASTGAGTDFVYGGTLGLDRASAATRFAVQPSILTDTEATVRFKWGPLGAGTHTVGPIARWTDSSNYLRATFSNDRTFQIIRVVGGTSVTVATKTLSQAYYDTFLDIRFIVYATGRCIAQLVRDGVVLGEVAGINSAALTGGALDDGKVGIYDTTSASTMAVEIYKFFAGAPALEPLVINADRSFKISDAQVCREDGTGVYTGRPATYLGSRFRVPVGTSRVLAKARRDDIDVSTDPTVTDSTRVQVILRSRGLVVPR